MPVRILVRPHAAAVRPQGRGAVSTPGFLICLVGLGLLLAGAMPAQRAVGQGTPDSEVQFLGGVNNSTMQIILATLGLFDNIGRADCPSPAPQACAYHYTRLPIALAVEQKAPDYEVQLALPGRDQVFRAEPEAVVLERIRREAAERREKAQFPRDAPLTPSTAMRNPWEWPVSVGAYVPSLVCYRPLYFEAKNIERYGWSLGAIQPLASTVRFYFDFLTLPYHMILFPPCRCECNAGYCLPGDPVPYRLYLPPCSWKGAASPTGADLGAAHP
jgi:hypothetical protein